MARFNVFDGSVRLKVVGLGFSWLSTRIDSTVESVTLLVCSPLNDILLIADKLDKDEDE